MEKTFNFNDFKNGKATVNKLGQKARFITETRGKMLVEITPTFGQPTIHKFHMNGHLYNHDTQYDLVMA